jgi:hypothetical protein
VLSVNLVAVLEQLQQWLEDALRKHIVAAWRAITSNVAKSPHCLLSNVLLRGLEQLNEDGHLRHGAQCG